MLAVLSSWLCRTEIDRARVVDNSRHVRRARIITQVATGVSLAIATPKFGLWVVVLFVLAVANTATLDFRIERSPRPELHVFASFVWIELLMAAGVAISGGPHSPALALMVLPTTFSASRFRAGVVRVLIAIAIVLLAAATVPVDPAGTVADPYALMMAAVLLVGLTACVQALTGAEYEQRGASSVDHLTGLLNRAALTRRFEEVAAQAAVTERPVSMLVGDVDRFKGVNDHHGHAHGDVVLRAIADALREELRAIDLIYRYGGEEFVVLLASADAQPAADVAERLRGAVEACRPGDLDVTISFGVATARGPHFDFDELFMQADSALYRAKQDGRNRIASGDVPALAAA